MIERNVSPFDLIKGLQKGNAEYSDVYSPYLTNKYFSHSKRWVEIALIGDTIRDSKMNFDFWKTQVKGTKYIPWKKVSNSNQECDIICEYFGVNYKRALEYLSLLSKDELNLIKQELEKREQ